ncbi:hypothetical protein BDD12DRAFT_864797 [Trichophaea hybrida]|nr:hypothetical protein BDD12DRAFT_864797 [Trichophaea hybrida]
MTDPNNPWPGYKVSLSLVEISALTTLVGATSAEAFALGLRGATGLSWASMSAFGLVHVIRSFVAAAVSDAARETLGLRNAAADLAVGMGTHPRLWMDHCNGTDVALDMSEKKIHSIYAFDRTTSAILDITPTTSKLGERLLIYDFRRPEYDPDVAKEPWRYWLLLACSSIKLAEVFTLWHLSASHLYWISLLPWLHGLLSAILLRFTNLSMDRADFGRRDVLTGELPSHLHAGGVGRLFIGLPGNVRRHYLWTIVWGTGAVISFVSLIATFLTLRSSRQPSEVIYIWVSFQLLWLLLRIVMYQIVLARGPQRLGVISGVHLWSSALPQLRRQAIQMMFGLAHHIVTIHPRGHEAYLADTLDAQKIQGLLKLSTYKEKLPHKLMPEMSNGLDVVAVVGDVVYRGLGWIHGKLDGDNLYDCVLTFLNIGGRLYAVPAVRVQRVGVPPGDIESQPPSFDPRGTHGRNKDSDGKLDFERWVHWIPMEDEGDIRVWAQLRDMKSHGPVNAKFLKQYELHQILQAGTLNISLYTEEEVVKTLQTSRKAGDTLRESFVDAGLL